MGTDLYRVTVTAAEADRVSLRLKSLSPGAAIEENACLAFHMICEAYWELREGELSAQPSAAKLVAEHPMKDEICEWIQLMNGERKTLSKEEHDVLRRSFDTDTAVSSTISSMGFDLVDGKEVYSVTYRAKHRDFFRMSNRQIKDVSLKGKTLTIDVENPALLAHLRPGMTFASRAYDHEGM